MARTTSRMLDLGTRLPDFSLVDAVTEEIFTPEDFADRRALLLMFICNHCPYVQHVLPGIDRVAEEYASRDVGILAINSNDVGAYPQDGPEHMRELARSRGWDFPFLFDETQEVARAFRAACTPEFYVFDGDRRLAYRGQMDDSRPGRDVPVTGEDLREALDAVLAGEAPPEEQTPSIGCNIKWKPGNAPDYA